MKLNNQKNRKIKKESYITVAFLILMAIGSILPITGLWYLIRAIIPISFLVFFFITKRRNFNINKYIIIFFTIWTFSLFASQMIIVDTPEAGNQAGFQKEILRVILYFFIVLTVQQLVIKFKYLNWVAASLLLFHLSIQILQFNETEWVFDFISQFYVAENEVSRHLNLALGDSISNFRSGSIFLNPNVYVPYPMLFLVIFLQNLLLKSSFKYKFLFSILSILSITSVFFTGSRTGLVGVFIIIVLFIFHKNKLVPLKFIYTIILTLLLLFVMNYSDARLFKIDSGLDDSYGMKLEGFAYYLNNVNPISYIVGNSTNIGSTQWHFDFEWGYIFVYYGIIGIFMYLMIHARLILMVYKEKNIKQFNLGFFYTGFLLVFLIESLSATVFYNVSIFYFFSIIFFSKRVYYK